jgi:hypothetical protein
MNNGHGTYESKIASRLQSYADTLSFDKLDGGEFCPKRIVLQAAHTLDSHAVDIYRKADGVCIRNARGKFRYLTWRERLAYWLLGDKPEIRP